MADTTKTQEVENENVQTQETGDSLPFEESLAKVLSQITIDRPGTKTTPPVYKFQPGVTADSLQKSLGYDKKSSFTVRLGDLRNFLKYESMKVEYKGEIITGQALRKKLGYTSRGKFVTFCQEQLKPETQDRAFKLVVPGVELPKFKTRSTNVPDALSMLAELTASVEPEEEEATEE